MAEKFVKGSKVVTTRDLWKVWIRYNFVYYSPMSYSRYYGLAFAWSMSPILKKLYTKKEDYAKALLRHSSFFITENGFGGVIHGIAIAMEEKKASGENIPDESFISMKTSLMGPIAGFGDSIFDSVIRTLLIATMQPLAAQGVAIAAIAPLISVYSKAITAFFTLKAGVSLGTAAVSELLENNLLRRVLSGAAVVSMFIMGSMSSSYVSLSTKYTFAGGNGNLQSILDGILPGLLPISAVMACYYLISKKNVSVLKLVIAIAILSLLLSFLGIV